MPNLLKGKRALVLGLGVSGLSAARFLLKQGAEVLGVDRNLGAGKSLVSMGLQLHTEENEAALAGLDFMVVSPGIPPSHRLFRKAQEANLEVIGEAELACRYLSQPCLAVTGTNGKTTVTLMVEHVLKRAGKAARAIGNVGIPLTSIVEEASQGEILVVELSSFQLETLAARFVDAGVILNITPDHLDRYASMEEYARAKIRLQHLLKPGGSLFVHQSCLEAFPLLFEQKQSVSYGHGSGCRVKIAAKELYVGSQKAFTLPEGYRSHDVENLAACYLLCQAVGVPPEQFLEGVKTFQKPPHRIQFVRSKEGVDFYDDSKGTNIDAVVRAVESFEGPLLLIAGGVHKGSPYTPWIQPFAGKVKAVCAIGEAAPKIKADLSGHVPVEIFPTLQAAVHAAAEKSVAGDTILLSPGCSSYDMFKSYAHRGEDYQYFVNTL